MTAERLSFGYSDGLPDPKPLAYWGARAIATGAGRISGFDLLWDRQSSVGTAVHLRELLPAINAHLPAAVRALEEQSVRHDERRRVVLVDNEAITIVANPLASRGYLYLVAWLKGHV